LVGKLKQHGIFCGHLFLLQMSHKRLAKYELEYAAVKQQEVETTDPIERLEVGFIFLGFYHSFFRVSA
jgi:hypothetical protein